MQAWQIDLMVAQDAEAAWNRLNAPDPEANKMKAAAVDLKEAVEQLDVSLDWIGFASHDLDNTPMQAKMDSIFEQVEDLKIELDMLREKWERGERE